MDNSSQKPFAPSCERNSEAIYKVLKELLGPEPKSLLELGSGTGQHAVYMTEKLPNLTWTCSDLESNHTGISLWLEEADNSRLRGPLAFEIGKDDFPEGDYDILFTANTLHIMSWDKGKEFIKLCGEKLKADALLIIYGPFNYEGNYTSQSNADFDLWLKARNPESAIRDFEDLQEEFSSNGFAFVCDYEMPANNKILVFKRLSC